MSGEALKIALARWEATRSIADAQAVDEAGELGAWQPPALGDPAFHRAWIRAAREPHTRGWAASRLHANLPAAARERHAMLAKRIEEIGVEPDPRVGRVLVALAHEDAAALDSPRVAAAWKHALARSFDTACAQAVRESEVLVPPNIRRILDDMVVVAATPAPQPGTTRPFDKLPGADEILRLWHECLAHPADDGPRAVLADLLLAANDARGELITLQLAGDGRERDHRIAELLAAHGDTWLGPLRPVARRGQFRRGFVARLELSNAGFAASLLDDPIVATLEDLVPVSVRADVYARWLAHPALRSLRRVQVWDNDTATALADCPAPLVHVAVPIADGAWISKRVVPALRARGVRSLAIPAEALDAVLEQRGLDALASISLGGDMLANLARWRELPPHVGLVVTQAVELESCRAAPWDARIEVVRTGGGVHAKISGVWLLHSLDTHLAALPREVTRVEVADASNEIALRVGMAMAPTPVAVVPSRYVSGNTSSTSVF